MRIARTIGTCVRGIRLPILKQGDDLATETINAVMEASKEANFDFHDRDVIAITESIVARTQGNYASIDDVKEDIENKLGTETIGVIFPILSRNRFSILLRGIAKAAKEIVIMLSYPSDEVGNALITYDMIDEKGVNPYSDLLTLEKYRELFGYPVHEFTGMDYVKYYQEVIESANAKATIIFSNNPRDILKYTNTVLACDIHTRKRTKRILSELGANVYCLDEILNKPVNNSGYNPLYGLLGSNKVDEEHIKLFSRDAQDLVDGIQQRMLELTGKHIEVMVYGDGAFKDPQGKIWELADPVVSPFHTVGLIGTPNEIKLKYLADNDYKDLKGEELREAIKSSIAHKKANLVGNMASQGTTPRQLTDLIGSLCDLTSGSGDKGTPVVLIQGYFDNYTNN